MRLSTLLHDTRIAPLIFLSWTMVVWSFLAGSNSAFAQYLPSIHEFHWDDANNSFYLEGSAFPEITLLEENTYLFYNKTAGSGKLYIADLNHSIYEGNSAFREIFHNGTQGELEYCAFTPNATTPRNLIYFNENQPSFTGSIIIKTCLRSDPIYDESNFTGSKFGSSMALDSSGNLYVGAPGYDELKGSVFFFKREENRFVFSPTSSLSSPFSSSRGQFGSSLSIFGNRLFVGVPDYQTFRGAVSIHEISPLLGFNGAIPLQSLDRSDEFPGHLFGWRVFAGDQAFASSALNLGDGRSGEVNLFGFSGSSFLLERNCSVPESFSASEFGYDLAFDESSLLVGAPESESAFLLDLTSADTSPLAFTPTVSSSGDRFGHSVALCEDWVFVGAPLADRNQVDCGVVHLFKRTEEGLSARGEIHGLSYSDTFAFGSRIAASESHLFVLYASASGVPGCSVYRKPISDEQWRLVSNFSIDDHNSTDGIGLNGCSLEVKQDYLALGMPSALNQNGQVVGVVQAFHNPSWIALDSLELNPIFLDQNVSLLQGGEDEGSVDFLFRALHPQGDQVLWEVNATDAEPESFDLNATSGQFSFHPGSDFNGERTFLLKISSGSSFITHSFSVSIFEINDLPEFVDQNATQLVCNAGDFFERAILAQDVDDENLSIIVSGLPEGLAFDSERSVVTGSAVEDGNFTLSVSVSDGDSQASILLYLKVFPANDPPQANFGPDDSVDRITLSLPEDFSLSQWREALREFAVTDSNEGQEIIMTIVSEPTHGVLRTNLNFVSSEDINFFPDLNFFGQDAFTIKFEDTHPNSDAQTTVEFILNILPVNDLPVISTFPSVIEANLDELLIHTFQVSDEEDAFCSIRFEGLPDWMQFDGLRTISGKPNENDFLESAEARLFLYATDSSGGRTSQSTLLKIIAPGNPPQIQILPSHRETVSEDGILESQLQGVYEGNSSYLNWELSEAPEHGSIVLQPSGETVSYTYAPDSNFSGLDAFRLQLFDSRYSWAVDSARIEVMVLGSPDPPKFAEELFTGAIIGKPWELIVNALDADPDDHLSLLRSFPQGMPTWWISLNKINSRSWALSGTPDSFDAVPVKLVLSDGSHVVETDLNLEIIEDPGSIEIIEQVASDPYDLEEDETWLLEGNLTVESVQELKISWKVTTGPQLGTFSFVELANGKLGEISYVPDDHQYGSDRVVIEATDGYSSDFREFNFEVGSVADPPIIDGIPLNETSVESEVYRFDLNLTDYDGLDYLAYEFLSLPDWIEVTESNVSSSTVSLSLQGSPTPDETGLHLIHIRASGLDDNLSSEGNFTIRVNFGNRPPVPQDEELNLFVSEDSSYQRSGFLSAEDPETSSEELVWMIVEQATHGIASIDSDGSNLAYLPDANSSYDDYFVIGVRDGGFENFLPRTSFVKVTVDVSEEEDPLIFRSIPTSDSADHPSWNDESEYVYEVEAFDADSPWQGYPQLRLNHGLPSWATWEDLGSGRALLRGFPRYYHEGSYNFSISAIGPNETVTQEFELEIRIDDYPPVFYEASNPDPIREISITFLEDLHGGEVDSAIQSLIARNSDYDSETDDLLSWSISSYPSSGALVSNFEWVSGSDESSVTSFSYSPPANFSGQDSFALKVDEGDRQSILPVAISIKPVADPPYLDPDFVGDYNVTGGTLFEVEIDAFDPDKQVLDFKLINSSSYPAWLKIVAQSSEPQKSTVRLAGTVPVSFGDVFRYTLLVSDPTGRWATKSMTIDKR